MIALGVVVGRTPELIPEMTDDNMLEIWDSTDEIMFVPLFVVDAPPETTALDDVEVVMMMVGDTVTMLVVDIKDAETWPLEPVLDPEPALPDCDDETPIEEPAVPDPGPFPAAEGLVPEPLPPLLTTLDEEPDPVVATVADTPLEAPLDETLLDKAPLDDDAPPEIEALTPTLPPLKVELAVTVLPDPEELLEPPPAEADDEDEVEGLEIRVAEPTTLTLALELEAYCPEELLEPAIGPTELL